MAFPHLNRSIKSQTAIFILNFQVLKTQNLVPTERVDSPVSGSALPIRVEKKPRMLEATRESPSRPRLPPGPCCPRVSTVVVPMSRCTYGSLPLRGTTAPVTQPAVQSSGGAGCLAPGAVLDGARAVSATPSLVPLQDVIPQGPIPPSYPLLIYGFYINII